MIITVPGIYEGQEHKARLFLDESSMKEIDVGDYRLVASNNENGPTVVEENLMIILCCQVLRTIITITRKQ